MFTVVVRLDPRKLSNPDLDIRYRLPDLLVERSGGLLQDDGYDYFGDVPLLDLFLTATDEEQAVRCVLEVLQSERLLGNELRTASVAAIGQSVRLRVFYPEDLAGTLLTR